MAFALVCLAFSSIVLLQGYEFWAEGKRGIKAYYASIALIPLALVEIWRDFCIFLLWPRATDKKAVVIDCEGVLDERYFNHPIPWKKIRYVRERTDKGKVTKVILAMYFPPKISWRRSVPVIIRWAKNGIIDKSCYNIWATDLRDSGEAFYTSVLKYQREAQTQEDRFRAVGVVS